jgi:hypothetical protein
MKQQMVREIETLKDRDVEMRILNEAQITSVISGSPPRKDD